jgi:hypothetical protein
MAAIDGDRLIEIAQAASAARYRRAMGLDVPVPPPPPAPDDVATGPFFAHIVQRVLWPPPDPYPAEHKEVLAVVPAAAVPSLMERLGLQESDLWKDAAAENAPSIVLGRAPCVTMSPDTYRPAPVYKVGDICTWTKRFALQREKVDLAEQRRLAADKERDEVRAREAQRIASQKAQEEAHREALRRADPRFRLQELERQLAEREAREKQEAARKLRELEERLAGKTPPT